MKFYRFGKLKNESIIAIGVILAIVIPFLIESLRFPESLILSILAIYPAYIVWIVITTENRVQKEIIDVKNRIKGSGVEIIELDEFYKVKEKCEENQGEVWFFNTPLEKIWSGDSFNAFLQCSLKNPETTCATFILNESEKGTWDNSIKSRFGKENSKISMKWSNGMGDMGFMLFRGSKEAFIFLLMEPFMIKTENDCQIMTLFWIKNHPEIILRLEEMFERHLVTAEANKIS